jgi:hypothetical protein
MAGVGPGWPGNGDAQALRVNVVAVAAFAAAIDKACPFQIGDQLADFARHFQYRGDTILRVKAPHDLGASQDW